ncbi:MAG: hypothetical protein KTR15_05650 [Phycisphaeraceae bacterium]|nr:hypothetical protein [Phycisphaeraceae bacterium]
MGDDGADLTPDEVKAGGQSGDNGTTVLTAGTSSGPVGAASSGEIYISNHTNQARAWRILEGD